VTGLWGTSLLATRVWQKQMQVNSETRQQVMNVVGNYISKTDTPITTVRLESFPDKFGDLRKGISVFYNVNTTWEEATDQGKDGLPNDTLIITYDNGYIIVQRSQ
jgi:hypothetical protein